MNSTIERWNKNKIEYQKNTGIAKNFLQKTGDDISSFANKNRVVLDDIIKSTKSNSVKIIAQEKSRILRALEYTGDDLRIRLNNVEKDLDRYANESIENTSTKKSLDIYWEVFFEKKKSSLFNSFSDIVGKNSVDLDLRIKDLYKAAGQPEATLVGFDLLFSFIEIGFHYSVGPVVPLCDLTLKLMKAKRINENIFSETMEFLASLDLLLDAMVVVSISLRQIPDKADNGKIYAIEYNTAKDEFYQLI